jgi:hypothetical protein
MRYLSLWLVLVLAAVAACSIGGIPNHGAAADTQTAGSMFAEIEHRLLKGSVISGRFTVSADGAFSASLHGALEMSRGAEIDLNATGTFGEDSVTLYLRSDGRIMEGGNAGRKFQEHSPGGLAEALLLGLTRMGILHNLARLIGGSVPDRADGGLREWVEVRDVQFAPGAGQEELRSELTALRFVIYVSGEQVAEATLWLDPDSGLPVRREQVVAFPGGPMRVTESYDLTIGGE